MPIRLNNSGSSQFRWIKIDHHYNHVCYLRGILYCLSTLTIGSSYKFDLKANVLMTFLCILSILSIKPECRGFQTNEQNSKTRRTNERYKPFTYFIFISVQFRLVKPKIVKTFAKMVSMCCLKLKSDNDITPRSLTSFTTLIMEPVRLLL